MDFPPSTPSQKTSKTRTSRPRKKPAAEPVSTVQTSLLTLGVTSQEEDDDFSPLEDAQAQTAGPDALTVSEVVLYLQDVFENDPLLGRDLTIRGELSNFKRSSRGHVYFTLKDAGATLNGILWAGVARNLAFEPTDGLEVYATGRMDIYVPSGTYSFVVKSMEPVGVGAHQLAFEQIRARLEAEGLFLPERKRPLPDYPWRIGIVTSRTGAVIHDMLRVIRRKNPWIHVLLAPVAVQGEAAAREIAEAIRALNHPRFEIEVILVGRGGGSFEDLFPFSQECVVRAIADSRAPVVTGIGHEPDFGLADAAADRSASTPTAAAELAVPEMTRFAEDLTAIGHALMAEAVHRLMTEEQTLDLSATRLLDSHNRHLLAAAGRLEGLRQNLLDRMDGQCRAWDGQVARAASELNALSPLATLARGYALAIKPDGGVLQSVGEASTGERFTLKLRDGDLPCEVLALLSGEKHAPTTPE